MMVTWQGYLKRFGRRDGARLLVLTGGEHPSTTERRIEDRTSSGRLTAVGGAIHMRALAYWRERYVRDWPAVHGRSVGDWQPLGDGCYQRRNHITGDVA